LIIIKYPPVLPGQSEAVKIQTIISLLAGLALCACSSLLPRGSTDSVDGFDSFEEAQEALEKVVAMKTRGAELKELGFDPLAGANVTLIAYPEIIGRLAPNPGIPLEKLDIGIRQCIEAQSACRGYLFHFEQQDRKRQGGFWLDFLNVKRTTAVTGWWFEALVVLADDKVLFRNFAGQAHTDRLEKQFNPLGPLQPAGEGAGAILMR
jgi:hypothetical protein